MMDTKVLEWLMKNADAPIRYRIAREFLQDKKVVKKIERELLENPAVELCLMDLKVKNPPQHRSMEHGSFDFCLENSLPKAVNLGLHGGLPQMADAVNFYINNMKKTVSPYRKEQSFFAILTANILSLADIKDKQTLKYMLGSLDEIYSFTQKKIYDFYLSTEEKKELTKTPKIWKNNEYFIKPELIREYGFSYPLIYDILGLHKLYDLNNPEVDKKIEDIIGYISTDIFHSKVADGYGILVEENGSYHSMGWDPKYPGWFDVADYMEKESVSKLLFFAQYIAKYPVALKTKWFIKLINCFEKYKTDSGTYIFPKEWMKESTGYAVQGHHMSLGENRRKRDWLEIESTFYVQLLNKNKIG
jgi:hypothetical protein